MRDPKLAQFLAVLETEGLEAAARAYYSVYRALVLRNDDPEERHRIQISCPSVGHDPEVPVDVWVDPAVDVTGDRMGWFNPPLVGSTVRVEFDNGNPGLPKAYYGGWWTKPAGTSPVPAEFGYVDGKPQKRGFRSRAGHVLLFDDTPGKEKVRLLWHAIADGDPAVSDPDAVAAAVASGDKIATISFDKDSVQILDANGSRVVLDTKNKAITLQDATGNLVTMSEKGISLIDATSGGASVVSLDGGGNINLIASKAISLTAPTVNLKAGSIALGDGASFKAVVGDILLAWLSAHTHGPPGSPPAAPPPPAILSQGVKTKT